MSTKGVLSKRSHSPTRIEQEPKFSNSDQKIPSNSTISEKIGERRDLARQNIGLRPAETMENRKSSSPALRKGQQRLKATRYRTETGTQSPLGKDSRERSMSPWTSPRRQHLSLDLRSKSTNLNSPCLDGQKEETCPELQKLSRELKELGFSECTRLIKATEKRRTAAPHSEQVEKPAVCVRLRPGARPLRSNERLAKERRNSASPTKYAFRNTETLDVIRSPRKKTRSPACAPEPHQRSQSQPPKILPNLIQAYHIHRATEEIQQYLDQLDKVRQGGVRTPPPDKQD